VEGQHEDGGGPSSGAGPSRLPPEDPDSDSDSDSDSVPDIDSCSDSDPDSDSDSDSDSVPDIDSCSDSDSELEGEEAETEEDAEVQAMLKEMASLLGEVRRLRLNSVHISIALSVCG